MTSERPLWHSLSLAESGKQDTATSPFQWVEIVGFCLRRNQEWRLGAHPHGPSQLNALSLLALVSYPALLHAVLLWQPHWLRWPVSHSKRSIIALLCPKPTSRQTPRDTASSPWWSLHRWHRAEDPRITQQFRLEGTSRGQLVHPTHRAGPR